MTRLFDEALGWGTPTVARGGRPRPGTGRCPPYTPAWRCRSGATRGWSSAGTRSPATCCGGWATPTCSPSTRTATPRWTWQEVDRDDVDLVLLPDEPYVFTADDGPEAFRRTADRAGQRPAAHLVRPLAPRGRATFSAEPRVNRSGLPRTTDPVNQRRSTRRTHAPSILTRRLPVAVVRGRRRALRRLTRPGRRRPRPRRRPAVRATRPTSRRTPPPRSPRSTTPPGRARSRLHVKGLEPDTEYGAHAHANAAAASTGADAGPHFQHVVDPVLPSVDPAYANPRNEIWLDLTTNAAGNGVAKADGAVAVRRRPAAALGGHPRAAHLDRPGTRRHRRHAAGLPRPSTSDAAG